MSWIPDAVSGAGTGLAALTAAVASAVAVIITALRKRRDVDVVEMQLRINSLDKRVKKLESELDVTREELVAEEATTFRLRRVLAQNGLADPTLEAS